MFLFKKQNLCHVATRVRSYLEIAKILISLWVLSQADSAPAHTSAGVSYLSDNVVCQIVKNDMPKKSRAVWKCF